MELQIIDIIAILIFLLITFFVGIQAFLLGTLMLIYSYLAGKEFFIGKKLRRHFFIYNGVNIIQMFLLQLFAYTFFAGAIVFSSLLLWHYIFTCMGTIIFEFIRKLNIPGADGTGKDTYTWHLGFKKAIFIYILLTFIMVVFSKQIILVVVGKFSLWLVSPLILFSILLIFSQVHLKKRSPLTQQLMQLSFLLVYAILNLVIYFAKLKQNG